MAAIDKAARLEADRQQAEEQFVQKVQQLDPPFPFKVARFDPTFFEAIIEPSSADGSFA